MELFRIIESPQNKDVYGYQATQNTNEANQLNLMIEKTNTTSFKNWHPYLSLPFKSISTHTPARFRPSHGKKVFYGSSTEETALYELAFHIMKSRVNKGENDSGIRTLFSVNADSNNAVTVDVTGLDQLVDKNDYSFSHQFATTTPFTFIIYPSARDPNKNKNAAILDINHLEKNINWEVTINFFYDDKSQQITWLHNGLNIHWKEVT